MPLVLTEHEGKPAVNASYFSSVDPADGKCLLEKYSDRFCDCNFGLLANLYACDGHPGKVGESPNRTLFIQKIYNYIINKYIILSPDTKLGMTQEYTDDMMVKQVVRLSHSSSVPGLSLRSGYHLCEVSRVPLTSVWVFIEFSPRTSW